MTTDTPLPHATDSERAMLGGMMMDKDAISIAVETAQPADCFRPAHRMIYQVIIDAWAQGTDLDPIVVAHELEVRGQLDQAGGAPYLLELVQATPTSANLEYHARRVADTALSRRLITAATRINQVAHSTDPDHAVDMAQQELAAVSRPTTNAAAHIGEVLPTMMDELDAIANGTPTGGQPTPTGFTDLDELTNGGLRPGQMIIVAARPGVGKSTLGVDIIRETAIRQGKAAVIFSLEMSKMEVAQRIISAEAQVPLSKMRGGKLTDQEWTKLGGACDTVNTAPIYIDDAANLTMMEIRAKTRRLAQQNDLGLIVVDYLQLLSSGRKVESRQQEVSEFSRQLKLLAKEVGVPLIAISQLNRGVEARGDDALPRVSDLRESGSLEQDADIVALIHRPDAKNPDHERAGEADIIIAKHRGGPIGTVTVANRLAVSRFDNLSHR